MVEEPASEDGDRDVRRLQLVAAPGHSSGQNGREGEAPVFIRTDAPEPGKTRGSCPSRIGMVMVHAVVVRLPQLENGVWYRHAIAVEHAAVHVDPLTARVVARKRVARRIG